MKLTMMHFHLQRVKVMANYIALSYKDNILNNGLELSPKLVGEAFYNGEVESELRRIKRLDYCFKQDSDRDICMGMIETIRRCNIYPHEECNCTTDCRDRGMLLILLPFLSASISLIDLNR